MSTDNTSDVSANDALSANRDFDTGLRLGIASALGQTGFNGEHDNPRRNHYDVFGWPQDDLDNWGDEEWLALYLRNGYAKTVNDKPADTAWRDDPIVEDTPDSEDASEFEAAVERAAKNKDLWTYAHRIDRAAGIGRHGLLVLGLSDVAGGDGDVWESDATEQDYGEGLDSIRKLKPVLETQIEEIQWGGPEDGARWGKPVRYTIDFSDDVDDETEDDQGTRDIHWSRVINVPATRLLDDETLARPRVEPVLNNILDIEKTLGSVAEAAFMSANSDIHLNSDPEKVDLSQGADEVRDELMRYFEGQPFLRTQGMDVEQLDGQVQDPSGIIESNLDEIAAATGIPKKELRGNQSGEVSGAEADERSWFGTVQERREQYVTPHIVRALVDRLVDLGIIPAPAEGTYEVEWPDLTQLSEQDQAELEQSRTAAINNLGQVAPGRARELATSEYVESGEFPEPEESTPAMQSPGEGEMQAQFSEEFGLSGNVEGVDLTPPDAAQNHAQDVLDWREDSEKSVSGMTDTGWERARQLASGEELSPEDVQEIYAWFARHGPEEYDLNDEDMEPWQDSGRVSIKGWGGPTMRGWVAGKRSRLTELGELEPVSNSLAHDFTANFDPDLHPRDDEGKFAETPGNELPNIDFSKFGTEEDRENVSNAFNEWAAWALSEETTPLWDAAREKTGNENLPDGPGIGSFLGDPQPDVQESVTEYSEWLADKLRDKYGDTIIAHRILHGDAAQTLRDGGRLEPRTLASWTTSLDTMDEIVGQTGADVDEDLSESVIVSKEIPVENVMGVHSANKNLDARGQDELVAALDRRDRLSDGEIMDASEVLDNV